MMLFKIDWAPNEVFLNLGPLTIYWYSVMFIIAFSLGYYIVQKIYINDNKSVTLVEPLFIYVVFGSLFVVFLYILLRFRDWQYSLGAVTAVFHDVLIVLGIFSLTYSFMPFNMEINQAFIAAVLTVIGYSLNDTVVVFDRIREFRLINKSWEFTKTVNGALNSTLSRTLNTSFTTLVVLLSIFLFGGESIRGFMFALIIGVLVGTYSSVFIATPVMFDTLRKSLKK
jgi:SecD/SecF fusion protein